MLAFVKIIFGVNKKYEQFEKKNQNPGTYGCINFHTAIIDKFFNSFIALL